MNTKRFIIIALSVLIFAGCASNDPKKEGSTTAITTDTPTEMTTVITEAETIAVIPPVPEEIPDIPDSKIEFSNDFIVVQVDTSGTTYANGQPVESDEADKMIQQAMTNQINQSRPSGTTATKDPVIFDTVESAPNVIIPEETELPTGTIFIDDTEDDDEKTDDKELFYLAKYVKTGNTDLAITDISVYSSSKPGVEGVDKFSPQETMLVNLNCNTEAKTGTTVYIVSENAPHVAFFAPDDRLVSQNLGLSFETSEDQLFFEIELPKGIIPGVYEMRFVCNGVEEGYIPFHLG